MDKLDFILRELIAENPGYKTLEIPDGRTRKLELLRVLSNLRPPNPVSKDFLESQDRVLQQLVAEKGIVLPGEIPNVKHNPALKLWKGDITRLRVDAIVNAANSRLLGCFVPLHGCIDNAIHSAAGIQLRLECDRLMKQQDHDEPTGAAKVTRGYNLPSKYVIHTVGPIIQGDRVTRGDEQMLGSCYSSCLVAASELKLHSIAFCCVSTGEFRFPNQRAAEIAVATVTEYLANSPDSGITTVIFDVFKDEDYAIYNKLLNG